MSGCCTTFCSGCINSSIHQFLFCSRFCLIHQFINSSIALLFRLHQFINSSISLLFRLHQFINSTISCLFRVLLNSSIHQFNNCLFVPVLLNSSILFCLRFCLIHLGLAQHQKYSWTTVLWHSISLLGVEDINLLLISVHGASSVYQFTQNFLYRLICIMCSSTNTIPICFKLTENT